MYTIDDVTTITEIVDAAGTNHGGTYAVGDYKVNARNPESALEIANRHAAAETVYTINDVTTITELTYRDGVRGGIFVVGPYRVFASNPYAAARKASRYARADSF